MKSKSFYPIILLFSVILLWNCSSDDDATNDSGEPIVDPAPEEPIINYFPLVIGNNWQYENTQTSNEETVESSETLTVESEQQVGDTLTYALSSNSDALTISATGIFSNGLLYKSDGKLLITGDFDLGLDETDLPGFNVNFEDLVVYDVDAIAGSVLFTQDENFDLPEFNDIDLNVNLSIVSTSLSSLNELEVNGLVYEDVIGAEVVVSMAIEATAVIPPLPVPVTVDVIPFQEVVKVTNYFANEVGLIQSETNLSVTFNEILNQLPEFNLEDIQVNGLQKLTEYNVSLED